MKHQAINLVKFKALSRRLKLPLYQTVGLLESLWLFCQIQARDGDLSRFSHLEIAAWLEWEGDEQALIDALVETRWLDREGDELSVHDWQDHKPTWLKGVDGQKSKTKPSKRPSRPPSTEPSSELSTQHGRESSTEPSRQLPNLTQPNPTKPKETPTEFSQSQAPRRQAAEAPEPSPFTFPVVGKGSKTWTLPLSELEAYREAFPSLDVDAQMRAAVRWCETNVNRRKTANGMLRFLTSWLNRATNTPRASPDVIRSPLPVQDPYGNKAALTAFLERINDDPN